MSSATMTPRAVPWGRICTVVTPSSRQSVIGGTPEVVSWASDPVAEDSGFTHDAVNHDVACSFSGRVLVSYSISAERANGTRGSYHVVVQRDSGSGFADVAGTQRHAYFRSTTEGSTAALAAFPMDVTSGDEIRLQLAVDQASPTEVSVHSEGGHMTIQRIQGAS